MLFSAESYYTTDCSETAQSAAVPESERMEQAETYGCLTQAVLEGRP